MTESALGWISPRSAKKWGPPDVASSQVGTQRLRHWFNQAVLLYPLPFSAVPRRVIGLLLLLVGGQTEPTVANWHGSLRVNQRNGLVGGDAILFCHLALNWCVGGGFEQSFFFFFSSCQAGYEVGGLVWERSERESQMYCKVHRRCCLSPMR